jgi:hypothetical protein
MRYTDRVTLTTTQTVYDPDQMGNITTYIDTVYPANISQISIQQQEVIFGAVNQDNRVVRVQGIHHPNKIKLDGKAVTIINTMYHQNTSDFYVRK